MADKVGNVFKTGFNKLTKQATAAVPTMPQPKIGRLNIDRASIKSALSKPFKTAVPKPQEPSSNCPPGTPNLCFIGTLRNFSGYEEFEVEGYIFTAQSGYKQIIDPQTQELSGKFIFDGAPPFFVWDIILF